MRDGLMHDETDCCAADPRIARHFDDRYRDLGTTGELPEMVDVSRGVLGLLPDVAEVRPTVLELGCGTGALTVELLKGGATRADGVDLSAESLSVARRRADEAGVGDRVQFEVGDGALAQISLHDWVVLDRVICCYAHVDQLLGNAISAAESRFIFSVPHDRGWRGLVNRLILTVENATNRFRGRPCPGYTHSIKRIEGRLADAGFRRLRHVTSGLWYAAIFERG
jgi:magnesium-protoporphyrin O-methyltransferase